MPASDERCVQSLPAYCAFWRTVHFHPCYIGGSLSLPAACDSLACLLFLAFGVYVGVCCHRSAGVHSRAVHKASMVSDFICLGLPVNKALMDGADKLYPAFSFMRRDSSEPDQISLSAITFLNRHSRAIAFILSFHPALRPIVAASIFPETSGFSFPGNLNPAWSS